MIFTFYSALHNFFAMLGIHVEPDHRDLRWVVARAWDDNAPDSRGYARLWMRAHFHDVALEYCRGYYHRTGHLPVGNHRLERLGHRLVYFRAARSNIA